MLLFFALQNNPAYTGPVVASTTGSTGTASNNFTLNMPSTRPDGDLYVAFLITDSPVNTQIQDQASWKLLRKVEGNADAIWVGYRKGASEPASYTFTSTGNAEEWSGAVVRVTGANAGAPIHIAELSNGGAGTSAAPPLPSLPVTLGQCLALGFAGTDQNSTSTPYGPTEFWTELLQQEDGAANCLLQLASLQLAAPTTVSGATFTLSAARNWLTVGVVISPAAATTTADLDATWSADVRDDGSKFPGDGDDGPSLNPTGSHVSRNAEKFDISPIPSTATINKVELLIETHGSLGDISALIWRHGPYNGDGITGDPQTDSGATTYSRLSNTSDNYGTFTDYRTNGQTLVDLGSAAVTDLQAARTAGSLFAVSTMFTNETVGGALQAALWGEYTDANPWLRPKLRVTYTPAVSTGNPALISEFVRRSVQLSYLVR